jgi:Na+/pantothenate symporter
MGTNTIQILLIIIGVFSVFGGFCADAKTGLMGLICLISWFLIFAIVRPLCMIADNTKAIKNKLLGDNKESLDNKSTRELIEIIEGKNK